MVVTVADLDPEGLERAAEALHNEKYPAWLWGTNEELQQHYRGQVSAAVTAYLDAQTVTTVEELRALPGRSAVLDADGMVAQMGANGPDHWDGFGRCWDAGQITLPATVIHRGGGQ